MHKDSKQSKVLVLFIITVLRLPSEIFIHMYSPNL